jgi:iron complex outermembrane receptor protein
VEFDVTRLGVYVTDQMTLGANLVVAPGLRWSRLVVDDHLSGVESRDALVSPTLGILFRPRASLSVYTSYARGFEPPAPGQYLEGGRPPDLSDHWMVEAGVKGDLPGDRVTAAAAGFYIERSNVPEADPRGFVRPIGAARSRGLELELVGLVAPGLTARAGYAFTDTTITRDALGGLGRELPNAPPHTAHVWLRYRLTEGILSGLMVAGGAVYSSDRFTSRDNLVVAPAYTRFDFTCSKALAGPRLAIGLVAENLTDRRYVRSGANRVLFAAPPRRIALQFSSAL